MLRLQKAGTAFIHVDDSDAKIEVPVGNNIESVFVDMTALGWRIKGHLDITSFVVHPTRILEFGGFLRPTQFATLKVVGALPSQLMLSVTAPPIVTLASTLSPQPCVCQDVTIGMPPESIGAEESLPGASSQRKKGTFSKRLALRVDPSREPVAWLTPTENREEVEVLEQRGAYTRVASTQNVTLVYGWVPTRDVHVRRPRTDEAWGESGMVGDFAPTPPAVHAVNGAFYVCQAPLALIANVNGETMRVGTIEPTTILETNGRDGGVVWLVPPQAVRPLDGVKFGVLGHELATCRTEP